MSEFITHNPNYQQRVRDSFARQAFMETLGAKLTSVGAGCVEMRLPYREGLSQQHGLFHGGVIGSLADNAGGYAAFSLLAAEDSLLTVEYKINILAPGAGVALIARGDVIRAGRNLNIVKADIFSLFEDGRENLCATALVTLMTLKNTSDEPA